MVGDFGIGSFGQPVHDPRQPQGKKWPTDKLTNAELFDLFGRDRDDYRWIGSADSEEYLAVVTYLVQRPRSH
jgi:hypothetical protein